MTNRNAPTVGRHNRPVCAWLPIAWFCLVFQRSIKPIVSWTNAPYQKIRSAQGLSVSTQYCSEALRTYTPTTTTQSILRYQTNHHWSFTGFSALSSSISDELNLSDGIDDDKEEEDAWYENLDVLLEDGNDLYGDDTEEDWIPDAEKAKGRRPRGSKELIPANEVLGDSYGEKSPKLKKQGIASPYTEEEEELIAAMGGKAEKASPREIGFLGDSTLREISRDYSVPICYLADVLAVWGVPVPISVNDRLGDLVTGEQAFALVEAVNTLDMGYLNDRYSNQNLLQLCDGWEINIKDAFEFAMKEGWSLPFGVRTNLRVEQEDELLRVFSTLYREVDDD